MSHGCMPPMGKVGPLIRGSLSRGLDEAEFLPLSIYTMEMGHYSNKTDHGDSFAFY